MTETASDSTYLYLTTTGWKTGSPHPIEIWFVPCRGKYYLVAETGAKAHWVQNIEHDPAITFRVGEQTFQGTGRVVDPAREPDLAAEVCGIMDAKYEWSEGLIVELSPSA